MLSGSTTTPRGSGGRPPCGGRRRRSAVGLVLITAAAAVITGVGPDRAAAEVVGTAPAQTDSLANASTTGSATDPSADPMSTSAPGLIVTLDDTSTRATAVALAAAERAGIEVDRARRLDDGTFVLDLDTTLSGQGLTDSLESLGDEPGIASVTIDRRLQRAVTPNDPDYNTYQWALKGSPPATPNYSANVAPAWDITTGSSSVVVAVLDTGYTDHPDLDPARLVPGYDFISDSDTANDGDGRDNDPHDPGDWITYTESNTFDGPFEDCFVENSSWHGTHLVGIIAATANNSIGVAGIDWGARILPVRVLGKCGGQMSDIIDAIRWSAGLAVSGVPNNPNPAHVINLSLGGSSAVCSSPLQSAINDAIAAGAVIVTAAGNSGTNAANNEPGNCAGVINVTSSRHDGFRASYGNYGNTVTLAAPGGSGTCSTGIRSLFNAGTQGPASATYRCQQGTSMAAPFVSAAVSLMRSVGPSLTPAQIRTLLVDNVRAFPSPSWNNCVSDGCGAGILDVHASVVAAGSFVTPDPPSDLVALTSPNVVTLSWTAPPDPSGYPVIDFVVQRSSNGGVSWTTVADSVSTVPSLAVGGLRNGVTYRFRIAALNAIGRSGWSTSISARPAAKPDAPRYPRATPINGGVRLSWTRPYSSGGAPVTDYVIQQSTDGLLWDEVDDGVSTAIAYTVTGLTNGVRYRFRVAAVNTSGPGNWSPVRAATPRTVPGAPTSMAANAGNRRATLTWVAPGDNGGAALQRYVLQRSTDGITWSTLYTGTSLATGYTARWLTNGRTYRFRVAAVNVAGRGPWTDIVSVRPRTTPGVPRNPVLVPGDSTMTIRWEAPTSTGGAPITGYRISSSTDGVVWTVLDTVDGALREYTATGLTNGVTVRLRVAAVNEAGAGPNTAARSAAPIAPAP